MFGKLLGAIVGFGLGLLIQGWTAAFVLAVLGVFVGHKLDALTELPEDSDFLPPPSAPPPTAAELITALPTPESKTEVDAQARAHFARHLCALFAEVARADGEVVRDEVRVVRQFFELELKFTPRELELVRASLKDALANPVELDVALAECLSEMRMSERLLLLDALYELALADGELRRTERDVIRRIADGLGITPEDQRSVAALFFGDAQAHYERLGLGPGASDEAVKAAFRRLAVAHHPDKVAHLGAGAQEVAARKFREIKDAYEELRRVRGF